MKTTSGNLIKNSVKAPGAALLVLMLALGGCATGAKSSIASNLTRLGLSQDRSKCVAREMNDRLDRSDLQDVARFLDDVTDSRSPGNVLDTLLTIDNPRAAAAFARAGIACAF
ncbi:MAG: hypothetical protein AAFW83_10685 [Pseudomonadota bacterium]